MVHLPFITRSLPKYSGKHQVGLADVEVPIPRKTIGNFKRKGQEHAGFQLETIRFALFYPAEESKRSHQPHWFPDFAQTFEGYLTFAKKNGSLFAKVLSYPFAYSLFKGTRILALQNGELLRNDKKWPVVFFSHGLAGNCHMYSAFCGELASRGYVVAAMESRDGSGPSTTIKHADGTTSQIDYINYEDLEWPDATPGDSMPLRHLQLEVRKEEFKALLNVFQRMSAGETSDLPQPTHATAFDWSKWRNIDASSPIMAGHSFGGATALVCSESTSTFSKSVVLDPWLEPLADSTVTAAMPLVINSEDFTVWSSHFSRLRSLVKKAGGSLFTIAGATHHSFSDFPLLLPDFLNQRMNLSTPAPTVMKLIVESVVAYLEGATPSNVTATREERFKRPIAEPGTVLQHESSNSTL